MFSSQSSELSLDAPCRDVVALRADRLESRFLVGSCGVLSRNERYNSNNNSNNNNQTNQIFLLRFQSESNELTVDATLTHTAPIQRLCSSPNDASKLVTCAQQSSSATVFHIPESILEESEFLSVTRKREGDEDDEETDETGDHDAAASEMRTKQSAASMEELATLQPDSTTHLVDLVWRDSTDDSMTTSTNGDVLTLDMQGGLTRWDLSAPETPVAVKSRCETFKGSSSFSPLFVPRVVWDPHANGDAVAVTRGAGVDLLDWRTDTSVPTGTIESVIPAHRYNVTDLDYNPNKPFVLTTAGQDGLMKFWDLRLAKRPLMVARGGHSHWISSVQYNPFHDQLVLTSGTDAVVNLWRVSTISSAPLLTLEEEPDDEDAEGNQSETAAPNVRVARHEHGDAVYGATWGSADAWIYLTVSYDGKVVLNHVPSKEKYKILL